LLSVLLFLLFACKREPHDYLIENVRYLRGKEITEDRWNVGVRAGRISYIGKDSPAAKRTLAGENRILAPGFIDTNTAGWVMGAEAGYRKLADGITTYLIAHGEAPFRNAETYRALTLLNHATTVGLATYKTGKLAKLDLGRELEAALAFGAYGISLAPEYTEAATEERIKALCQHFAGKNVPFSFHTRYSDKEREIEGLEEALACQAEGNPVHVLHIHSTGGTYAPERAYELVRARRQTNPVIIDIYPYTFWLSGIHMARFQGDWQARYGVTMDQVRIGGAAEPLTREKFEQLRKSGSKQMIAVESIPQRTLEFYVAKTDAFIGSDSDGSKENTHPRATASFTRFIHDYVHTGKVSFDDTLFRFSTRACETFSPYIPELAERGTIEVGKVADLILWNLPAVKPKATIAQPLLPSEGVALAFVNGNLLLRDGKPVTAAPPAGKWLRGAAAKK
jgi:N-acyl-D-aspartate/D-glutamate deacylase